MDETVSVIAKALQFAATKHRTQRRKNAEADPYVNHPIDVFSFLVECRITNKDVLAAALLHDTLEDTDTTEDELRREFGPYILDLVKECSDDKTLPPCERKRLQILNAAKSSFQAKLIKLADKWSNVRSLRDTPPANWSPERIRGYIQWSDAVCRSLYPAERDMLVAYRCRCLFAEFGVTEPATEEELEAYYAVLG